MFNLTEAKRAYFYRIALALLAVAVLLKWVGPDSVEGIAELAAALLGIGSAGLATANTDTKSKEL